MKRKISIGAQSFSKLRESGCFYIDKTNFIKEWWENEDIVTLITRPRRFGKTLNMSMIEDFFSVKQENRSDLFEGLSIWNEEKFRELQGTYPIINLSFASIKETSYELTRYKICQLLVNLYSSYAFLLDSDVLTEQDRAYFKRVTIEMNDSDANMALYQLSDYLCRYYKRKVIILLDEYDTPLQEAYVRGFWNELSDFTRSLFNSTFKTNPWLERGIMTGITRVSRESVFSDLNNLEVVTATSEKYAYAFGFTEAEVFAAMDEMGRVDKEQVKQWYDGFTFGTKKDIYNPWSILNYLDKGSFSTYWANTSGNSLISRLLWEGSPEVKADFERLLGGGSIHKKIDEQVVYNQLTNQESAIWSLLVASGYLRMDNSKIYGLTECDLSLTNQEVALMFSQLVQGWFGAEQYGYNAFIKALLADDRKAMNAYMNQVALATISYMDTGSRPSAREPERFYHGLVLGLLVELKGRYVVLSNRESGYGRYDVMLEPLHREDHAIIMEFKVFEPAEETTLEDTVRVALLQIEDKKYSQTLIERGIQEEQIYKYGFAFEGKKVLIG